VSPGGSDRTDSLVAYALLFSPKVETLIPPKKIGSYQCRLLLIMASFVTADETGCYVTTAEHASPLVYKDSGVTK
jgi:hypothetical protein